MLAPSRQDIYQGKLVACHQVKGQGLHRLTCPFSFLKEQLAAIPEFQGLGPLFKSSEPVQLTEAETEYVVRCIKHTFARHMVFQFDCTNTLNDQLLQKVSPMVPLRLFQESSSQILTRSRCISGCGADGAIRGLRGDTLHPGPQSPLQSARFLLLTCPPA